MEDNIVDAYNLNLKEGVLIILRNLIKAVATKGCLDFKGVFGKAEHKKEFGIHQKNSSRIFCSYWILKNARSS